MAKRVLVVDDAIFMRNMIKDIFASGGFEVIGEAANGLEEVWGADAREMPGYREALIESAVCINAAQSAFDDVDVQLINLRDSLALTQADYDRLQGKVDAIARSAYMNGPGANLEMLLGASSMGDPSSSRVSAVHGPSRRFIWPSPTSTQSRSFSPSRTSRM